MRTAFAAGAFGLIACAAACDDHARLPSPASETAEPAASTTTSAADFSRCEFTIDAIGFTCSDGRVLSVRHDPEMGCVIVMVENGTYALPRDYRRDGYVFQREGVVFERTGDTATFTRSDDAPYENCVLEDEP
jgi:hypothetical protein